MERDLDSNKINAVKQGIVNLIKLANYRDIEELFRTLEILEEIERGEGVYFGDHCEILATYIHDLSSQDPRNLDEFELLNGRIAILRAKSWAKNPDNSVEFGGRLTEIADDLSAWTEFFESQELWDEALESELCASALKCRFTEIFEMSLESCFVNFCEVVNYSKFCAAQVDAKIERIMMAEEDYDDEDQGVAEIIDEEFDKFSQQQERLEDIELKLRTIQVVLASRVNLKDFAFLEAEQLLSEYDFDENRGDKVMKGILKSIAKNRGTLKKKNFPKLFKRRVVAK